METSFVRLDNCVLSGRACFLLSRLKEQGENGIDLTLTDGEKFWEGKLTVEDLDTLCLNIKMDFKTYVSETVKAFTSCNMGDLNFEYQLKSQTEDAVDFLWKKEVCGKEIKMKMGSVTLHLERAPVLALTRLFSQFIEMASLMQDTVHRLGKDNMKLTKEKHNALNMLEKCISAKEKLEQDLYSKFAAVLNSKKEKIRQLKEGCVAEAAATSPACHTSSEVTNRRTSRVKGTKNSNPPALERKYSEHDEQEIDSDNYSPPVKRSAPMTHRSVGADTDDSLALGDDDDQGSDRAVVKRPARHGGGNKRQTPSKPVLPKVTSPKSPEPEPSSERKGGRGSMKKSRSGNSQRSSSNLDTDELLDKF